MGTGIPARKSTLAVYSFASNDAQLLGGKCQGWMAKPEKRNSQIQKPNKFFLTSKLCFPVNSSNGSSSASGFGDQWMPIFFNREKSVKLFDNPHTSIFI
jgi:hypothetical protein